MTEIASFDGFESPFDNIREYDETGEFWRARKLQELVEYETWHRFADAIERARSAMINIGQDPDVEAGKINDLGVTGYDRTDYRLSRYGAYMVVMNCDPRQKPKVAEAQSYFAIKTREAELGINDMPKDYPAALRAYASAIEEALEAKKRVAELAPKAEEYDAYMDSDGNLTWALAAQTLYGTSGEYGRTRLMGKLREAKIVTLPAVGEYGRVYQKYIDKGYFVVKIEQRKPKTYVTPSGLSFTYKILFSMGEDVIEPKESR